MDEAAFEELYKSAQLRRFLCAEARRHFGRDEDLQKDAVSEAWTRIVAQPDGQTFDEYRKHGARAIHNLYERLQRRRKRILTASIDDGKKGKPSSALYQLAQKAVDGDW
jgi:hypothetical protein